MPYIKEEQRDFLEPELSALISKIKCCPKVTDGYDGVLNYTISAIVAEVVVSLSSTGWRYYLIARAIAVFECAKLEFYRRVAAPYEDKCIEDNGDVGYYGRT